MTTGDGHRMNAHRPHSAPISPECFGKVAAMDQDHKTPAPNLAQRCRLYPAEALYVSHGVNHDEPLLGRGEDCLGDQFSLDPSMPPQEVRIWDRPDGYHMALPDRPAEPVTAEACYRMMAADGSMVDLQLLRAGSGRLYLRALAPLSAQASYSLVDIAAAPKQLQLEDFLCVAFARGTRITLADGRQCPIERLEIGARVLTRDHGAQAVRHLARASMRAFGGFAPVVITAGALGNEGDLLLSPQHRMFRYARSGSAKNPQASSAGAAELLVQAKHLIDGAQIFQREGGYVDYFSPVFDHHEIIYAEGIPAESLQVSAGTMARLAPDLAQGLPAAVAGAEQPCHVGIEIAAVQAATLLEAPSRMRATR